MIELYFRPFMQFYFPSIEAEIDWTYPPKFLDQKLQKIVRDGETGKRYADKLVQVLLSLYNFLDFMMTLPESLSQQFDIELEAFEETKKMKYVTTTERRILARAEARGEAKQARSFVQRLLNRRFGDLQDSVEGQISSLSIAQLESLGLALLDFTTIEDLTHWLETQ